MSLVSAVVALALAISAGAGVVVDPTREPTSPATVSAPPQQEARWAWPIEPAPEVARRFDPPDQPWLPGHRGVDLVGAVGQVVRSPTDGTVTYAGRLAGRGVVVVTHAGGLRSTFEPVSSTVRVGSLVSQSDPVGQISGEVGHCSPATCLHWGVLRGRTYLDPLAFVGRGRIVLLPLG
ncbi:M23 family metallopeptidase [Humibacillus xanthopallidus]|uniref:Peptidase M23-like protein n=1 Tax=Humibacillus xanthopallidus TaxID=412689 RepID=A0A543HWB4_9MICO|nr:M23 family metallopeptidase [Humibacillus xanthopallidus]TQM62600.1 peptidase M23-like protein [Humibacillus xanthopallidus]